MKRLLLLAGLAVVTVGGTLGALLAATYGRGSSTEKTATYAAAIGPAHRFAGTEQTPQTPPDFALRDQDRQVVRLSREHGKFVLITFLYTNCPDVCPLIAANLNDALRKLGSTRSAVRVLSVSVDPRGDTPAEVRRYVRKLHLLPQFRYLIGTKRELTPIWRAYHVLPVTYLRKKPIGHSTLVLLLDRSGKTRLLYDARVKTQDVLHDLRLLGVRP